MSLKGCFNTEKITGLLKSIKKSQLEVDLLYGYHLVDKDVTVSETVTLKFALNCNLPFQQETSGRGLLK